MRQERESSVYAIVRCGGRQEKAAVDEVLTVDTLDGEAGSSVDLPALLVVDDDKVISDPAELSRYQVTAEILGTIAGPKINMIQFKNKTGYRRRLGHRVPPSVLARLEQQFRLRAGRFAQRRAQDYRNLPVDGEPFAARLHLRRFCHAGALFFHSSQGNPREAVQDCSGLMDEPWPDCDFSPRVRKQVAIRF